MIEYDDRMDVEIADYSEEIVEGINNLYKKGDDIEKEWKRLKLIEKLDSLSEKFKELEDNYVGKLQKLRNKVRKMVEKYESEEG